MSTIDLILLGSICQSPKSAYDLQKQIEARKLSRWVKIGSYTAYKKVAIYEAKGYVTSKTSKSNNMPEKTIYTITEAGEQIFRNLMKEFSKAETRVFLDFNAVIVNLGLLDEDSAITCLDNIKQSIQNTKMQLEEELPQKSEIPIYGHTIIEQQLQLLEVLERWEENFEKQLLWKGEDQK